uniref:Probable DNA polymerase n=1 Tax=Trametes coccinea TaxID=158605 RepID=A0A7S9A2F8_TRACO|nr:DNA polymerase [Trametes coccinea]QPF23669.1 DNA polymerase [Trametes coccinea]
MFNDTTAIVYKFNSTAEYHVKFNGLSMEVEYVYKGKTLFKFIDELLDKENLGSFNRIIKNQKYQFLDGKILYKERICNYKIIKPLLAKPYYNNKFITMDLETRNVKGILVPYAIALFDGENSKTFYVTDYKDHNDMVISAIKSIMLRRYNGYKEYWHQFIFFYGIFLLNKKVSLADSIQPIINENRYVNTKFKFYDNEYKLEFRDSLLMVPVSLRKLAKAFDVEDKTIFPYNFFSEDTFFKNYAG